MKQLVFVGVFLISVFAFAETVKVTSFRFLESGSRFSPAAEMCGVLISPTGKAEMIKITADPKSKGPATYYVWSGPEGKFCSVIATYTGTADAELQK